MEITNEFRDDSDLQGKNWSGTNWAFWESDAVLVGVELGRKETS